MVKKLDAIDRKILNELQQNGRIRIVELAERVNLSKTPCAERLKRLEQDKFIQGYSADLNANLLDQKHVMFVQVSLDKTNNNSLLRFNEAVKLIPEIQSCFMVAANFDYLLQVRTTDITHFRKILGEQIGKLPGVQQTHSFVVMEEVFSSKALVI